MIRTKAGLRTDGAHEHHEHSDALSHEEIAIRAHALYEGRGQGEGGELMDWLEAERELLAERMTHLGEPPMRLHASA